ncbi:wsc domain containing protein [Ophiostoma piceae UAMH 11346]|uniref:Wsc domain containing protein n=1 Tax=Ophiostoma piceae (strain UAMH 11346) TaxID=1262450 RepID=S3BVA1_OPHP1|nr:wsc domain containing protein [Ophiostoma piceae UAMH 11346]
MKSLTVLRLAAAAGLAATASAAGTATMGVEQPSSAPIYKQPVVQGCFSSAGDLVFNSSQTFNSRGECGQTICQAMGAYVAASSAGDKCYCGNTYPANSTLVDDSKCNSPCTGYGQDACGGDGFYTVYNTGLKLSGIAYADDDGSSSSSSSPTAATSTKATSVATTVVGGQTVFVTQTSDSNSSSKKSSSNTAGIAGGVVAGVVVVAAIVGGVFFMLRRRRNREIEEEHRRNAAVNAFFNGASKAPSTSGEFSSSDARLDPVMAQRRMSDGSIADNEDYSRRILRVTNA